MRILPIIALLLLPGRAALAADQIAELIAAVEQAESYYARLKLDLTSTYRIAEDVGVGLDPNFQEHIQNETQWSIVLNDEQFRVQRTTISHTLLEDGKSETVDVFDARMHRNFWKNTSSSAATGTQLRSDSFGQISDEHPSLTNLARPHMFLLESVHPEVPLSTYLKGHAAVLAHPNPGYFAEDTRMKVHDFGSAEFEGLRCRRILIDFLSGSTPHNGCELWLVEERNFIPIRNIAYTYPSSKEVPMSESAVDDWQELRPGVWFPMKAHTKKYDKRAVRDTGQKVLRWQKEYEVRNVSLDPETTPATFTELEFPPGTKVREIENGVEVTK